MSRIVRYEIRDYKPSAHLPTQEQVDQDRQLALYQIGVEEMWDDVKQVDLIWHHLRFDQELRSQRTPEQLDAVRSYCIALIDEIESLGQDESNFPTNPSALCNWCDYVKICPATKHQIAVEMLPPEQFHADDGVSLVNRWTEMQQRRRELESKAKALKGEEESLADQVIKFATDQGLEQIVGSTHHATVKQEHAVEYPKAGAENRQESEEAVR